VEKVEVVIEPSYFEESRKQIELIKKLQQTEPNAEKRKTKINSATLVREDRER